MWTLVVHCFSLKELALFHYNPARRTMLRMFFGLDCSVLVALATALLCLRELLLLNERLHIYSLKLFIEFNCTS